MKNLLYFFLFLSLSGCGQTHFSLKNFPKNKIMVVAHRGDWREAPENSLWAIKKAIEKGVNMVEIDLAMTKDSILILLHDKTLDRTTTAQGVPADFSLEELRTHFLKDGLGMPTQMTIPTLEEALQTARGKVFLNLDKTFPYFEKVQELVEKYQMNDQILYKANVSYAEFDQKYGKIKDKIHFMPIIRLERGQNLQMATEYIENYTPFGFELTIGSDETAMIDLSSLKKMGFSLWVNSLWAHHNAGHHDDKALENPHIYEWYVKNHINIIQTDRPKELIQFLKKKRLYHKNP